MSPPSWLAQCAVSEHQTTELWFKLAIHELTACLQRLAEGDVATACKIIARIKAIQHTLYVQWQVLATMTPAQYVEFRSALRTASGFQSVQYRVVEFLLGQKDPAMLRFHKDDPADLAALDAALRTPSLYDQTLRLAARRGLPIPREVLERDVATPYVPSEGVARALAMVYEDTRTWWDLYDLCEKLMDLDEQFAHWRFRHYKTVARIIGEKPGTGGSAGVHFLRQRVDGCFFPELYHLRTTLRDRPV
ncbi:hypothetical protein J4558_14695 [Leptolyngbya sp. 15MV]|nr:hypothetical protein J4558_14695 [Leptolyngbya sp. 15MV]